MIRRTMQSDRERLAQMERHYRRRGYEDGYNGRSASSTHATYQASWRRGREARAEAEGGESK